MSHLEGGLGAIRRSVFLFSLFCLYPSLSSSEESEKPLPPEAVADTSKSLVLVGDVKSLREAYENAGGGTDEFEDYELTEEQLSGVSGQFFDGIGVPKSAAVSVIFELIAVGEKDATWSQFSKAPREYIRAEIIEEAYRFMDSCLLLGQCQQSELAKFPQLSALFRTNPKFFQPPTQQFQGFYIDRSQEHEAPYEEWEPTFPVIYYEELWTEDCWLAEVAWGERPVAAEINPDIDYEADWCAADSMEETPKYFPDEEFDDQLGMASEGSPESQLWVARYFHENSFKNGELDTENAAAALEWYERAANSDYYPAHLAYAQVLEFGSITEQDSEKAFFWIQMAAESSGPETTFELAGIYFHGEYGNQSYQKALELYSNSARSGHAQAQLALGYIYEKGLVEEINLESALDWYLKAWNSSKTSEDFNPEFTYRLRRICTLTQAEICKTLDISLEVAPL